MAAGDTPAERFARAREEFVAAMAAGCSIAELRQRRAHARAVLRQRAEAEVTDHTAALMAQPRAQADFLAFDASWMMRD